MNRAPVRLMWRDDKSALWSSCLGEHLQGVIASHVVFVQAISKRQIALNLDRQKSRIPSTMTNFDQMWICLLSAVYDKNLAWKQLLSALNNETKHGCNRCHFKPCDISVFNVSIMCSLRKRKKKIITRWFLVLSSHGQHQGHNFLFFFFFLISI